MTKTIRLLPVLLLATSAFAREEYTRIFDKTLSLKSGERVNVENKFGDIVIRTHSEQSISIHAEIKVSAGDLNQAKDYAKRVEIIVEPVSELSVRTRYPESPKSFLGMRNVSFSVQYSLTVPENSPLAARNAFGGVSVTGAKAGAEIVTSNADVKIENCRGRQQLQNSFGRVEVHGNAGDVRVDTSNGSVEATDITGGLQVHDRFASLQIAHVSNGVSVTNSNGSVDVRSSGGVGDIRNSFGNVTVKDFRGDLTVNDSNGAVEATDVSGWANLRTTFGEIHFENIGGAVSAKANNSHISGNRVGGALTVVNSFGAVEVRDAQRDVHVESGNGEVVLDKVGGSASVKTSFGEVRATNIGGGLTVENSNGGVKATNVKGAQVNTSFGPIMLGGVSGPIHIESQNGAVEASSALRGSCQPIDIRTSFSVLRIRLESDASYRVAAKTSFGKVRSDFPISVSGAISNDDVNGTLGSGKCDMHLSNSNGGIEILRAGN